MTDFVSISDMRAGRCYRITFDFDVDRVSEFVPTVKRFHSPTTIAAFDSNWLVQVGASVEDIGPCPSADPGVDGTVVIVDGLAFQRDSGLWYEAGSAKSRTWLEVNGYGIPEVVYQP